MVAWESVTGGVPWTPVKTWLYQSNHIPLGAWKSWRVWLLCYDNTDKVIIEWRKGHKSVHPILHFLIHHGVVHQWWEAGYAKGSLMQWGLPEQKRMQGWGKGTHIYIYVVYYDIIHTYVYAHTYIHTFIYRSTLGDSKPRVYLLVHMYAYWSM